MMRELLLQVALSPYLTRPAIKHILGMILEMQSTIPKNYETYLH